MSYTEPLTQEEIEAISKSLESVPTLSLFDLVEAYKMTLSKSPEGKAEYSPIPLVEAEFKRRGIDIHAEIKRPKKKKL